MPLTHLAVFSHYILIGEFSVASALINVCVDLMTNVVWISAMVLLLFYLISVTQQWEILALADWRCIH